MSAGQAKVGLVAVLSFAAVAPIGCGSAVHTETSSALPAGLLAQVRPIGRGPRFDPPNTGAVPGRCARELGPRSGVHVELFAANRVVIVPGSIGTRPPRRFASGRLSRARCYGDLVTIDPTGLLLIRPGLRLTLSDLFRAWGEPLSATLLASFSAQPGERIVAFVEGRRWRGSPASVPLRRHSEIVLEIGPHVPPHVSYAFPPGT